MSDLNADYIRIADEIEDRKLDGSLDGLLRDIGQATDAPGFGDVEDGERLDGQS